MEQATTEAISKISLGILRGRVKPSLMEKDVLYDIGKFGELRGVMQTLLDGRRMIALFENHDSSTVLHEMAHFWLEELRDAQLCPSCPAWARRVWHGLEDAFEFDRETVEPSRWKEIQERFALEFEDYCMDGVAPTPDLQPAFDKFREWVSDVYSNVTKIIGHNRIRTASRKAFNAILGESVRKPKKPAYKPLRM